MSFPDVDPHDYDRWYDSQGRKLFELEVNLISELLPEFTRGLEVGTGTGRFAQRLGLRFGVDPSLSLMSLAKERGVICVAGVCEKLPFRDSSFDLVLLAFTLCFLDNPEECFAEIHRVLEPEGKVIIGFIPEGSGLWKEYRDLGRKGHRIYREAVFYRIEKVKEMLEEAGFLYLAEGGVSFGERGGEVPDFAVILAEKVD